MFKTMAKKVEVRDIKKILKEVKIGFQENVSLPVTVEEDAGEVTVRYRMNSEAKLGNDKLVEKGYQVKKVRTDYYSVSAEDTAES